MQKHTSRCQSLFAAVLLLALASLAQAQPIGGIHVQRLAPYVPSPPPVVDRMLELAELTSSDTVYDLGSGDGRIVITAAQQFGARAVGVEIDPELVRKTRARIRDLNLTSRVRILNQDALTVDLSSATVVTLYLLTASNKLLKPNLERSLRPGARVVSHDFAIEGWKPLKTDRIRGLGRMHTIYLYEIGKH